MTDSAAAVVEEEAAAAVVEEEAAAVEEEAAAVEEEEATKTKPSALMDFGEEEEEEDESGNALLKPAAPSSSSLMDFGEEEEEGEGGSSNAQDLLLQKQKKRTKLKSQSEDEEEGGENGEASPEKTRKKKKDKTRKKDKKRSRQHEEAEEADEDEEEEIEDGFQDLMDQEEAAQGEDIGMDEFEPDEEEQLDVISQLSLPSLHQQPSNDGDNDKGEDDTVECYALHLPKFLSIAAPQFDSAKLSSSGSEEGHVVRWRERVNPSTKLREVETNASLVEYEDGTMDVFVGGNCVAKLKLNPTSNEFVFARATSIPSSSSMDDDEDNENRLCFSKLASVKGTALVLPSLEFNQTQLLTKELKPKRKIVETLTQLDPEQEQDLRSKRVDAAHRNTVKTRNRQAHSSSGSKRTSDYTANFLEQGSGKKTRTKKKANDDEEDEEEEDELKSSSPDDASSSEDDEDD
ncbi:hypothetical protein BASA81_012125 [Batrachochytrium salamandrivorans]|nr:hypothetical protein BASA81_012125 [Batrachochytrium salamandrivorans]